MTPQPLPLEAPAGPTLRFEPEEHRYYLDPEGIEVPGVTRVLQDSGIIDFSMVPPATLERARLRGTAVHQALHYLDDGELDGNSLDEEHHGYVMAYCAFKNQMKFEPGLVEHMAWSYPYRYAGRMDRVGSVDRGDAMDHWLIDFKTGMMMPGHAIQLAAYAMLLAEPRKYRRGALQLNGDGTYKLHEYPQRDLQRDFQVFQAACAVWHWKRGLR